MSFYRVADYNDRQFRAVEFLCSDQSNQRLELGEFLVDARDFCLACLSVYRDVLCVCGFVDDRLVPM